jgi:methylphosphotriester-DNA--protein-cysteine methyltransferase
MKRIIILLLVASLVCIACYSMSNSHTRLVASIHSREKVYHYETCKYVKKMKLKNLRVFASPEEAIKAGYKPCTNSPMACHPPVKTKEN